MQDAGDLVTDEAKRMGRALARVPADAEPAVRARVLAAQLRDGGPTELVVLLEALADELDDDRRRLELLGFELHDGPLQDLTALRNDVHLFRRQLAASSAPDEVHRRLLGRVDDLIGRTEDIGRDLRAIAAGRRDEAILDRPLPAVLGETVDAYREPCAIVLDVDPFAAELSDSRRIALVRIVEAALANVVEHSAAVRASVRIGRLDGWVVTEVVDEGHGFDVESTLRTAEVEHRLGLAGMRERARTVGGRVEIESAPGGPTAVRLFLPAD
jgi:signal transduction histidine kinase